MLKEYWANQKTKKPLSLIYIPMSTPIIFLGLEVFKEAYRECGSLRILRVVEPNQPGLSEEKK